MKIRGPSSPRPSARYLVKNNTMVLQEEIQVIRWGGVTLVGYWLMVTQAKTSLWHHQLAKISFSDRFLDEWIRTKSEQIFYPETFRICLHREDTCLCIKDMKKWILHNRFPLTLAPFTLLVCNTLASVFADPQDENKIGIDGVQQFCDDLILDPASVSILVVAWKFRAATQCEFSRKEFLDGMAELGWATLVLKSTTFD